MIIWCLGINGEGIGYYKYVIIFVKGVFFEEVVVVEVIVVYLCYLEVKICSICKFSFDWVDFCDVYVGEVGGFELEYFDYLV